MTGFRILFCTTLIAVLHAPAISAQPAGTRVITVSPDDPRVANALAAMAAAKTYARRTPPKQFPPPLPEPASKPVSPAATAGLGWAPYAGPWQIDEAAHLLHRALIGPRFEEMVAAKNNGLNTTLTALLTPQAAPTPPGAWVTEAAPDWGNLTEQQIQELVDNYLDRQRLIILWWVQRIAVNQTTLTEPMTFFWHDHFATNADEVFYPQAIYGQLDLMRTHSLGNFKTMALEMCTDPAMLIWLNGDGNTVYEPNENFARELLELFTMGEGSGYTQQDVVNAARACTGYVTDGVDVFYIPQWHDNGSKTILGQTGNWGVTELINILFQQPATAYHVCDKLYRWFVDDEPAADDIEALAVTFRNNSYNVAPVLQQIMASAHFYDPTFRGAIVKDGVEMYAGNVRSLHAVGFDPFTTANDYEKYWVLWQGWDIGQTLTQPPNVAGWPGQRNWINTASLPLRKEYAGMILYGNMWSWPLGFQVDVIAEANRFTNPNDCYALVDDLSLVMLGQPPTTAVRQRMVAELLQGAQPNEWSMAAPNAANRLRDLFHFAMRLPDYELK